MAKAAGSYGSGTVIVGTGAYGNYPVPGTNETIRPATPTRPASSVYPSRLNTPAGGGYPARTTTPTRVVVSGGYHSSAGGTYSSRPISSGGTYSSRPIVGGGAYGGGSGTYGGGRAGSGYPGRTTYPTYPTRPNTGGYHGRPIGSYSSGSLHSAGYAGKPNGGSYPYRPIGGVQNITGGYISSTGTNSTAGINVSSGTYVVPNPTGTYHPTQTTVPTTPTEPTPNVPLNPFMTGHNHNSIKDYLSIDFIMLEDVLTDWKRVANSFKSEIGLASKVSALSAAATLGLENGLLKDVDSYINKINDTLEMQITAVEKASSIFESADTTVEKAVPEAGEQGTGEPHIHLEDPKTDLEKAIAALQEIDLNSLSAIAAELTKYAGELNVDLTKLLNDENYAKDLKLKLLNSSDLPEEIRIKLEGMDGKILQQALYSILNGLDLKEVQLSDDAYNNIITKLHDISNDNKIDLESLVNDDQYKDLLLKSLKDITKKYDGSNYGDEQLNDIVGILKKNIKPFDNPITKDPTFKRVKEELNQMMSDNQLNLQQFASSDKVDGIVLAKIVDMADAYGASVTETDVMNIFDGLKVYYKQLYKKVTDGSK